MNPRVTVPPCRRSAKRSTGACRLPPRGGHELPAVEAQGAQRGRSLQTLPRRAEALQVDAQPEQIVVEPLLDRVPVRLRGKVSRLEVQRLRRVWAAVAEELDRLGAEVDLHALCEHRDRAPRKVVVEEQR